MRRVYHALRSKFFSLLVFGLLVFLTGTELGLQCLYNLSKPFLPNTLQFGKLHGRLLGTIKINNIDYQLPTSHITIEQVDFTWQPWAILQAKFRIKNLTILNLKVIINADNKTTSPETPSLSSIINYLQTFYNAVQRFQLDNLEIIAPGTRISLNALLNEQCKVNWQADIANLHTFINEASGSVHSQGAVTGPRHTPIILNQISATNLQLAKQAIGSLQSQLSYNHGDSQKLTLTLNTRNIGSANYKIKTLQITLAGQRTAQGIQASVKLSPATIDYFVNQKPYTITISNAIFAAELNRAGLSTQLTLNMPQQQQLTAQLTLPNYDAKSLPEKTQTIIGQAHLKLSQLDSLPIDFNELTHMRGNLSVDTKLSGALYSPLITSQIDLQNGTTDIPSLGIKLKAIQLHGTGNINKSGQGEITFNGSANSLGGTLNLQGNATTSGDNFNAKLILKGTDIGIMNTAEYQVFASPDITLGFSLDRLDINGNIFIPRAILKPNVNNQSDISTADIVYVNSDSHVTEQTPLNIYSQIKVTLGNAVNVNTAGLTGRLAGAFTLQDNPKSVTTATGEILLIDGKYQAYGQTLTLRKSSRLTFTGGPVDDPGINVQAVRTVTDLSNADTNSTTNNNFLGSTTAPTINTNAALTQGNIMVGISLTGTLKNQQISLFSEPAGLSQEDILSYLVLGHPVSQASVTDAQVLLRFADNLNPGGSSGQIENITQQIKQTFGLTELGVESVTNNTGTTPEQNTSLVLGKALSPKLYLHYSVGLIKPVNILKISYLLSSKWRLQTESNGSANGIDLLYTIEH